MEEPRTISPTASTRSLTGQHVLVAPAQEEILAAEATPTKDTVIDAANDEKEEDATPKSPLLTSHRLSTTSMDNVNLEEDSEQSTLEQDAAKGKGAPCLGTLQRSLEL